MCGIAGIVNLGRHHPIDENLLKEINRTQTHRGPDDEGYYFAPCVGLAHRRLSILDLAGGHQPLFNEDKSVAVVFNGEIYNFEELVLELQQAGHRFKTRSDTEVIVHGWEEWGEDCVSHFEGMFAFGLWDSRKLCVMLARDRLGKKPLYYSVTPAGQLVFGSELKVLASHPDIDKTLRHELAEEFFMFGYVPDPHTAYRSVFKLEAGHRLLAGPGRALKVDEYWDITLNTGEIPDQDSVIDQLQNAVKARMIADVPVGAFLSGGVDSSAVVAMMALNSKQPVTTCSISFDDEEFDESEYARRVAQRYQTDHHSFKVTQGDFSLIESLVDVFDEPFADSSALPTYRVCEAARKMAKVVLTGDGGDEIFGGYRRYRMHLAEQQMRDVIPGSIRRLVFGALGSIYPKADWAPKHFRAKTTFQSMAMGNVEAYGHSISKLRQEQRKRLFSGSYYKSLDGYRGIEVMKRHAKKAPSDDPLKMIQYLDLKTWLTGDILTKVDRASMAHSLEVRSPLLDHKFVAMALSLPSSYHISRGVGKLAFKRALEPYVDPDILYRQKMGFGIPLNEWLRGPFRREMTRHVVSSQILDCGFFDIKEIGRMVTEHSAGRSNHGEALWCLLMFSLFLQRHT